jgi:ankyrin repeat protein
MDAPKPKGTNCTRQQHDQPWRLFSFAAQSGRAAVVRFLLDHGADVNAMGDGGRALLNAAKSNAEITAMLRAAIQKDAGSDRTPR